MLTTLLVPQIVGRIATRDCGTIDRMVTLLQPLPPRNTAGIVGAVVKDPVSDQVAWDEYLEVVVRPRAGWSDFYAACRAVADALQAAHGAEQAGAA